MRVLFVALLLSVAASAQPATFVFDSGGKQVEGIVSLPSGSPRGLILYFHRAIEDRQSVNAWGELLNARGYAVAGYTATGSTNYVEEARAAVRALRGRRELGGVPLVAMGASMGTRAAAKWFGSDSGVRALILLVPGDSRGTCADLAKAAKRPVLMIQAEKDEIVDASTAEALRKCRPAGSVLRVLSGKGHRFPPSDVSDIILSWLDHAVTPKEGQ